MIISITYIISILLLLFSIKKYVHSFSPRYTDPFLPGSKDHYVNRPMACASVMPHNARPVHIPTWARDEVKHSVVMLMATSSEPRPKVLKRRVPARSDDSLRQTRDSL